MKIKISKYPKTFRLRIHDNYMDKKYGIFWVKNKTKFENLLERIEKFVNHHILYYINNFTGRFEGRSIKIQISKDDVINVDDTLSHIIYNVLVKYKKEWGESSVFEVSDEDIPEFLRKEDSLKKVGYIIDEMIFAFEYGKNHLDDDWSDLEKMLELDARAKNGRILFAKYFNNLWL